MYIIETGDVVSATPQKCKLFIVYAAASQNLKPV